MNILEVDRPRERSQVCESILRSVPDWFGIESATRAYVEGVASLPTSVAEVNGRDVGFLSLKQHGERAAEIWVMAVVPELHRRGAGNPCLLFVKKL